MTEANVRLTKFNDADFAYSVSDDSMIGARMLPGDNVLVKQQDTVDYTHLQNAAITIQGRHDPCIVPRAAIVQTTLTAFGVLDLYTQRFGTEGQIKR